jgi:hypothetical protein
MLPPPAKKPMGMGLGLNLQGVTQQRDEELNGIQAPSQPHGVPPMNLGMASRPKDV